MCPSRPPDARAWRDQSWQPRPRRPRDPRRPGRLKHPWITALAVVLGLLLGLGGLGSLLEDGREPTSGSSTPTETSTRPPARSPAPPSSPPSSPPRDDTATPAGKPSPTPPPSVVVVGVVDGDTLDVRGDGRILPKDRVARVRLLEVDTPEKGACFADEATARTTALLPPGSRVRVQRDVELMDRYDRHLLYVWTEDGTFLNESLVRSGHAEAVLFPPNDKHWTAIAGAEDAARQAGAGLLSACPETPPQTPAAPGPADPAAPDPADSAASPDAGLPDGPPAGVPDVDCSDLPGPVRVGPDDPHRLDRDGDGIGCDAN
ncbi:hypothetical protein GCM10027072_64860 [Streptomyces bullii]